MRLLVCGDRNWTNKDLIKLWIQELKPHIIIHGAAKGADKLAGEIANELGITVSEFPADWNKFGKSAGPIRNLQMLSEGKPDRVLAFHNHINNSKGTKHMLGAAERAGLICTLISEN